MKEKIAEAFLSIREATGPVEKERFWKELHRYHERDIFPEPRSDEAQEELDLFRTWALENV